MSDTPAPQPRIYSRRGNNCFPVWEQNVPSMGMCVGTTIACLSAQADLQSDCT